MMNDTTEVPTSASPLSRRRAKLVAAACTVPLIVGTIVVAASSHAATPTNLALGASARITLSSPGSGSASLANDGSTTGNAVSSGAPGETSTNVLLKTGVTFDMGGMVAGSSPRNAIDQNAATSADASSALASETKLAPTAAVSSDPATVVAPGIDGVAPSDAGGATSPSSTVGSSVGYADVLHSNLAILQSTAVDGSRVWPVVDSSESTQLITSGSKAGIRDFIGLSASGMGPIARVRLNNTALPPKTELWITPKGDSRRVPSQIGSDPTVRRIVLGDPTKVDPVTGQLGAIPANVTVPLVAAPGAGAEIGGVIVVAPKDLTPLKVGEMYFDKTVPDRSTYTVDLGAVVQISGLRLWAAASGGAITIETSSSATPIDAATFTAFGGTVATDGTPMAIAGNVRYIRVSADAGRTLTVSEVRPFRSDAGSGAFWRANLGTAEFVDRVEIKGEGTVKVSATAGGVVTAKTLTLAGANTAAILPIGATVQMIEVSPAAPGTLKLYEVAALKVSTRAEQYLDVDLGSLATLAHIDMYPGGTCCAANTVTAFVSANAIPAGLGIYPAAGSGITTVPLTFDGTKWTGAYTGQARYVRIQRLAPGALSTREVEVWGVGGAVATSSTTAVANATTTTAAAAPTTTAPTTTTPATTTTAKVTTTTAAPVAPVAATMGSSLETAAPSCWAIKQARPTAPSGRYWLRTAAMIEPRPFYCDQVTDGGGWVLVGRGMADWEFDPAGQGAWTNIDEDPDGTTTKAPLALPSWLVNQVLSNQSVSTLEDGVRLRRAANGAGTAWQEVRWQLDMSAFDWYFPKGYPIRSMTVNGASVGASATTRDTMGDDNTFTHLAYPGNGKNDLNRVWTFRYPETQFRAGFTYGVVPMQSGGWWASSSTRLPMPFTQVYLRPKNTTPVATTVPATGIPSFKVPLSLRGYGDPALNWGVADFSLAGQIVPYDPQQGPFVLAMHEAQGRMFVGGAFLNVQQGPTGTKIAQKYLTSFDVKTGQWNSTCRPNIDGRVWDMAPLPDGSLLVAGDFTSYDGDTNASALAKINPLTCQHDASFKAKFTRDGARALIRAMDVQGDIVFVGGRFNKVETSVDTKTPGNTFSFNWKTMATYSWRPATDGTVLDIDASPRGDRVYVVGTFLTIGGQKGLYYATNMATGAVLTNFTWIRSYGDASTVCCNGRYQQAVREIGDEVWIGGREHIIAAYDRNTAARKFSHITAQGGDYQEIYSYEDKVWGACHCNDYDLEGYKTYATGTPASIPLGTDGKRKEKINWTGQYSTGTDTMDGYWLPSTGSLNGDGPWALMMDSTECLWIGGDIDRKAFSGNAANDWAGHFARYCQRYDRTVPSSVSGLTATTVAGGVKLSWAPSTDAGGGMDYIVLRDGIAIARLYSGTTFTDTTATAGTHQYTVYATDTAGNRGASAPPVSGTKG